jgi:hypothetical protein
LYFPCLLLADLNENPLPRYDRYRANLLADFDFDWLRLLRRAAKSLSEIEEPKEDCATAVIGLTQLPDFLLRWSKAIKPHVAGSRGQRMKWNLIEKQLDNFKNQVIEAAPNIQKFGPRFRHTVVRVF